MKICGIIRPKSIKIVAELDNYDLTEEAMIQITKLYNEGKLPMTMGEPTDTGDCDFFVEEYPLEQLTNALVVANKFVPALDELRKLIHVVGSMANLIEEAIEELHRAPLTINVNMESWLEKPAGYFKEMDDV